MGTLADAGAEVGGSVGEPSGGPWPETKERDAPPLPNWVEVTIEMAAAYLGVRCPMQVCGGVALISFLPGAMQRKAKLLCQNCGYHFCGFCTLGKRIHNHTGVIPSSGPLEDGADLDRHIVDCGAWANDGGNKWWQALQKYVPVMIGLYPTPRLTQSLRAQVARIMEAILVGPTFAEGGGNEVGVVRALSAGVRFPETDGPVQGEGEGEVWGSFRGGRSLQRGGGQVHGWARASIAYFLRGEMWPM